MLVIGITGGIGSGKNLAADFFRSRGAAILDADHISRELASPGSPLLAEIIAAFGPHFLRPDGSLDRAGLAQEVFAHPPLLARLNAITHPPILAELRRRLEALRRSPSPPRVVCVIAPLLLEALPRPAEQGLVDRVLVITASEQERVRRVMERDRLTEREVRQRMAAQMPAAQQAKLADWVVDTTAGKQAALSQLERIWSEIAQTPGK